MQPCNEEPAGIATAIEGGLAQTLTALMALGQSGNRPFPPGGCNVEGAVGMVKLGEAQQPPFVGWHSAALLWEGVPGREEWPSFPTQEPPCLHLPVHSLLKKPSTQGCCWPHPVPSLITLSNGRAETHPLLHKLAVGCAVNCPVRQISPGNLCGDESPMMKQR